MTWWEGVAGVGAVLAVWWPIRGRIAARIERDFMAARPRDAEGFITISGRSKDMIIRGGENVYPREIEEFLYTHADIVDVQVVGVPDVKYGEEIMAWVRVREGATALTVDDVRAFCQGRIAHYKVPRYVHVVDEFPMTVTGKIQKYKLRDAAVELLGLHDAASIRTA